MHILNVLFAKKLGGIEQAFVDYARALQQEGLDVHCLCHPKALIRQVLGSYAIPHDTLMNWGAWDRLAVWRLHRLLQQRKPDAVIAHGNRALTLLAKARAGLSSPPVLLTVAHNPRIQHMALADGVIAVNTQLQQALQQQGVAQVVTLPNMLVDLPPPSAATRIPHMPPVIGLLARFVPEKDVASFLQALAILRQRGHVFQAMIGGDGPEAVPLHQLATRLALDDCLHWQGWVKDKDAFYAALDIFCLSSRQEAFGIVLLEAMAHGLPLVATRTPGPSELVVQGENGLLCPIGNASALADALEQLLHQPERAYAMGQQGARMVQENYSLSAIAPRLRQTIEAMLPVASASSPPHVPPPMVQEP